MGFVLVFLLFSLWFMQTVIPFIKIMEDRAECAEDKVDENTYPLVHLVGDTKVLFKTDTNQEVILESFKRNFEQFKEAGYGFLIDGLYKVKTLKNPRYGTYYLHTKNISVTNTSDNDEFYDYVITHEIGHKLYYVHLSKEEKKLIHDEFRAKSSFSWLFGYKFFPSEYSKINEFEWFAEVFSYYFRGKLIEEFADTNIVAIINKHKEI